MAPPDDRPDLPPEQDAVRRLLAEARHDEPVPPAVAARLDAVLAELTAERREERPTAPVVDLAARRRRRGGTALLAAAAVVVAGVGLGQVLGSGGGMGDGGSDAGGVAESFDSGGNGAESEALGEDSGEDSAGAGADEPAEGSREGVTSSTGVPDVSSDTLRRDLRSLLTSARTPTAAPQPEAEPACAVPRAVLDDGDALPVTLDGRPALAIYEAPRAGRQRVAVYLCSTAVAAERVWLRVR